jgi:hypothetical protein
MNFDVLLYWMTHLGEGSWGSFRKAVCELASEQAESSDLYRNLRLHFSELGHVDFFANKSQKWRVRSPILGGLIDQPEITLLCGGRTPKLLAMIEKASAENHCEFLVIPSNDSPSQVQVKGSEKALQAVANSTEIQFVPNLAKTLVGSLISIDQQLDKATEEPVPHNWLVRSFDLNQQKWVNNLLPDTAHEYSTNYGQCRYFVTTSKARLVSMSKRESIYAAAMLRCISLARYHSDINTLTVPSTAPLPENFSRIACLSSGNPSRYENGNLVYERVPPSIAALLFVLTGQPFPNLKSIK